MVSLTVTTKWKVVMIADATDDDFTPLAPVLGMLSEAGALPELWNDGTEGLRRLMAENADLVVVDLDTPSLCGMDAQMRIAQVASRIPVILMASRIGSERRMWALESGAVSIVTKPVDGQTLFRYIDKLLKIQ
ncbi:MAG: response regulator [Syntrophorhabdaceae bacterium]|nr:response regulator [Syntrophorhabdaceae bacterium]